MKKFYQRVKIYETYHDPSLVPRCYTANGEPGGTQTNLLTCRFISLVAEAYKQYKIVQIGAMRIGEKLA